MEIEITPKISVRALIVIIVMVLLLLIRGIITDIDCTETHIPQITPGGDSP